MSEQSSYKMPGEWTPHQGTLVAWPDNDETWGDFLNEAQSEMVFFIKALAAGERVYLALNPDTDKSPIQELLSGRGCRMDQICLLDLPHDDCWMRDCGPNYVLSDNPQDPPGINVWDYNAWGGKYPPFNKDQQLASIFADQYGKGPIRRPGLILEGGSIEVNGQGLLLTTESCLLNPNRNPQYNREEIEQCLRHFLGVQDIIWLKEGIVGDDTDGHIDDFVRFISPGKILCSLPAERTDPNYEKLKVHFDTLCAHPVIRAQGIDVECLPHPEVQTTENPVPASYANFYIANHAILVPVFNHEFDQVALETIQKSASDREVIPIPCQTLIRGLGALHCLTQPIY